ncbi:hypothetical protein OHA79_19330 [Streptomyces sp. NBC_00841]|uniref:hypothetical protein n=1 Tax=unclassified Streptomyces TaxID=2593676 RepID=UPI00225609F5|nr:MULTISPECIES: hypothetical protein [unclassified Streptomyces]MCX4534865.1 hypothetical protein [Streptomyces sp. NBC_01669]WRZ99808.1 hypothetical protein OHA79_19330 [Streptomyces sp. NBC_00841]
MPQRRIGQAWLAACTAAAFAFGGLMTPAHAEDSVPTPPPGKTQSWVQEPRATMAEQPAFRAQDFTEPGGAASSGDFTLTAGSNLTSRVERLDAILPKQGVQNLLLAANRTARVNCADRDPFLTSEDPAIKYCLMDDDSTSQEWIPQAVTGVSDAKDNELWGTASDITMFGSYDNWNPGRDSNDNSIGDCNEAELKAHDSCNEKGVRVTFVQRRADGTVKYRHVLLGWLYENSADHISYDALHADEKPLQAGIHAGGMVWYGNYLYVADTMNGIRVFSMEKIMDLDPDGDPTTHDDMGADTDGVHTTSNVEDKTKVGRQNNVWYSYGYRYVMPQVASWKFKSPQYNASKYSSGAPISWCTDYGAPKASYLSLDRSTTPDRLVMGEYCRPGIDLGNPNQIMMASTGRISSYPIANLESWSGDVAAQPWANYLPKEGIQGAAAYNGNFYFNQSSAYSQGSIWQAELTNGKLTLTHEAIKTAVGPEDLYIERGRSRLWSVSEHTTAESSSCVDQCQRVLYAHDMNWLQAQP